MRPGWASEIFFDQFDRTLKDLGPVELLGMTPRRPAHGPATGFISEERFDGPGDGGLILPVNDKARFAMHDGIGLTSGASTPDNLVGATIRRLSVLANGA